MKVYAGMDPRTPLPEVAAHAARVERLGYDGLHVPETIHDSIAVSLLCLQATSRLTVRTSVTLAFVRSPTLVAYGAWDLAKLSGGRFQLGLGTQIRQNVEERFGMPWGDPLERMRDYVGALRALFAAFADGAPVHHAGRFYRLTRLQPYFNPGPDPDVVPPSLWLGGVNAGSCELAGELADGFVTHPTNSTERYLETIALPHLEAGARRAGRDLGGLELVIGLPVITGPDAAAVERERERQRRLFAFLYSTPAYRRTLELHGWQDLDVRLRALIRQDRWQVLPSVVTDELLDAVAVTGGYADLPGVLASRVGRFGQGALLPPPRDPADDPAFADVVAELRRR